MIPIIRLMNGDLSLSDILKTANCFLFRTRTTAKQSELSAREKSQVQKENNMKKDSKDELREEYDLSKLKNRVRGKYAERYRQGTNLILLEPEIAKAFPDAEAVNGALRMLIQVAENQTRSSK